MSTTKRKAASGKEGGPRNDEMKTPAPYWQPTDCQDGNVLPPALVNEAWYGALFDVRLSAVAKMVYVNIIGHVREGTQRIDLPLIAQYYPREGVGAVVLAINELIEAGYLVRPDRKEQAHA